jgi:hypothetical protein
MKTVYIIKSEGKEVVIDRDNLISLTEWLIDEIDKRIRRL